METIGTEGLWWFALLVDMLSLEWFNFECGDCGGRAGTVVNVGAVELDSGTRRDVDGDTVLYLRRSFVRGYSRRFLGESIVPLPCEDATESIDGEGATMVTCFEGNSMVH